MRSIIARGLAGVILCAALIGAVLAWNAAPAGTRAGRPMVVAHTAPKIAPKPKAAPPKPTRSAYLESPYVVKSVLPIDGPMKQGDWYWDERGVPVAARSSAIVITVDLAARTMSVFRDGYEIGATVVALGADEKPTPLGIFPITQKDADHVSNIYHAPMPYMLRLTNDGVSIHASKVASEEVTYVTHGCIGVPMPFAQKLFAAAKLGDRVIVTRGERLGLGKPISAV